MKKKFLMLFCLVVVCFTMTGCVNPIKKIVSHYAKEIVEEGMKEETTTSDNENSKTEDSKSSSKTTSSGNPKLTCKVTYGDGSYSDIIFEVTDNVNKKMDGYMVTYVDISAYGSLESVDWDQNFCSTTSTVSNIKDCYTKVQNSQLLVYYIFDTEKMINESGVTSSLDLRDVLEKAKEGFEDQQGYSCILTNMD